ncbi:hypothetical protein GF374_02675 [Candidatus Woesearchaeota archaeon]|nr:hypothetical protein [Candidatus Woesearchaeota archaeon]
MIKLKTTHYLVLLISSLLLSILYLNMFLNFNAGKTSSANVGAASAIPNMVSQEFFIMTIITVIFVYVLWVWIKSDEIKKER